MNLLYAVGAGDGSVPRPPVLPENEEYMRGYQSTFQREEVPTC